LRINQRNINYRADRDPPSVRKETNMQSSSAKRVEPYANLEPQLVAQAQHAVDKSRLKSLQVALRLFGVIFIFGIYLLSIVWPSGWVWHTGHTSHYLQMIMGVYATLGVFLLMASRNPLEHLSLIWFTVWSSVVHAAIMMVQAITHPEHIGHLWGDVAALYLIAAILAYLTPRTKSANSMRVAA
jgi:hypothetical protein